MPPKKNHIFLKFGAVFIFTAILFLSNNKIASAAGLQWYISYDPLVPCPTGYLISSSTIVAGVAKTDCDYSFLTKPTAPTGPVVASVNCCKEKVVAAPLTPTASAATSTSTPFIQTVLNPLTDLQVKIPGLDKLVAANPATCDTANGQTSCSLPWISLYINAIYNYSMAIVGILAAVALMIGGVIWLTSLGNATRPEC